MNLNSMFTNEYSADGIDTLQAPGCMLASPFWANEYGPLAENTAFGILPLAASKETGSFLFSNNGNKILQRKNTVLI